MCPEPDPRIPRWSAPALERRSLHEETVEWLRRMVLEGELPPSSYVPEVRLCEHLGISRTPMREALKVLAAEGLIELRVNRGAFVAPVTASEVANAFEVIVPLDELAGQLACERISDQEIEELMELHRQLVRCFRRRDRTGYFRTNNLIHNRIQDAAHNPILASTYANLAQRVMRARAMPNMSVKRWRASLAEHESFMEALAERDGDRLARELAEHMRQTRMHVLSALDEMAEREPLSGSDGADSAS